MDNSLTKGISLIEMLVSLFLLSFLLLGFEATQLKMLQASHSLSLLSIATQQLNQIRERLSRCDEDCSAQIAEWNEDNSVALPQGRGRVTGHYPHYIAEIFWGDKPSGNCEINTVNKTGCLKMEMYEQ